MDPQLILAQAQDALWARRVFGDPIQADGVTMVPVAAVAGGGGGGTRDKDGGVGFGVKGRAGRRLRYSQRRSKVASSGERQPRHSRRPDGRGHSASGPGHGRRCVALARRHR